MLVTPKASRRSMKAHTTITNQPKAAPTEDRTELHENPVDLSHQSHTPPPGRIHHRRGVDPSHGGRQEETAKGKDSPRSYAALGGGDRAPWGSGLGTLRERGALLLHHACPLTTLPVRLSP